MSELSGFLENDKTDLSQSFFQGLGKNTCSLQPALKNTALDLTQVIIVKEKSGFGCSSRHRNKGVQFCIRQDDLLSEDRLALTSQLSQIEDFLPQAHLVLMLYRVKIIFSCTSICIR